MAPRPSQVPYSRSASVEQKIAENLKKIAAGEEVDDLEEAEDREDVMKLRGWAKKYNWDWGFVGWRALVELFGREHNHVAEKLLEWCDTLPCAFVQSLLSWRPGAFTF
jgi:hypothetical protein